MDVAAAIARAVARADLTADEMAGVMGTIMDGDATPAQIGGLLVALRMKGETVAEVVGAARAMRARATKLSVPAGVLVDTCGTGGDGRGTINVSTIAAFVVAAAGVTVAKHGNRAQSSRAGSADVLEALGVDVAAPPAVVERCLREVGIGFLFAPAFHAATRHAAGPRKELGVRTVFNLLGPLTNPAGARRQLIGVYARELVEPMAQVLALLDAEHALVVHGAGGLDEFAPDGPTEVAELRGGEVKRYKLSPRDFALEPGGRGRPGGRRRAVKRRGGARDPERPAARRGALERADERGGRAVRGRQDRAARRRAASRAHHRRRAGGDPPARAAGSRRRA